MAYYACVDNRTIIDLPESEVIPGQDELAINGNSYRRLDPTFFAWIESRITTAINGPRIDQNTKRDLNDFLWVLNATGAKPDGKVTVPNGYTKPDIAERTDWLREIDWDDLPDVRLR